jgi:hypothetical protein
MYMCSWSPFTIILEEVKEYKPGTSGSFVEWVSEWVSEGDDVMKDVMKDEIF